MGAWGRLAAELAASGRLARIAVAAVAGSAPREVGAAMLLRPDGGFTGTIGGGAFEWRALAIAGAALAEGRPRVIVQDLVLGPDLGQCCGGRVTVLIEIFDAAALDEARALAVTESRGPFLAVGRRDGDRIRRVAVPDDDRAVGLTGDDLVERFGDSRRPVLVFGAGHVGRALILALAPLPFRVRWVDGRPEAFPGAVPGNATPIAAADPVAEMIAAPPGSLAVILTHDHALDLALVDAGLRRADLPYLGCIGSRSKRARFSSRLLQIGHSSESIRRMVCPIGVAGVDSKAPAVIAASVAVELLIADRVARNTLGAAREVVRAGREECV
ncbi:xanthine dehydrogenase accessory protein XdhC [Siculibacillus lacustris]|uniref:Xanthine dehydrogenase accessory protein XdhC n=1 Tax=Siculibacillus lacustris TaxID=1549641 RepID=A0A4Q9VNI0_9HYPH|nr:xanthine dehydrogenase accessory protein XdhC [Siculibacillus lacustris]